MCRNLNCISIMMSFLTCITGFLWILNFCLFWPIMQIRKKGGWNLKKIFSSETTEPISTKFCWNYSWMAPFQNCVRWSRFPTKMAAKLKIEKTWDEILIVHCCFSVSQIELKFNCSYMARNSLTYIPGFSVKFFFQPIYTDYAN